MSSIWAHNKTNELLKLKDYYVWDDEHNLGYYGVLEHAIVPRGCAKISLPDLAKKLLQEKRCQEIHVKRGQQTLLVLHHDELDNNGGSDLLLEMGSDGVLRHTFVRRETFTVVQRIRAMFGFRGGGRDMETPL